MKGLREIASKNNWDLKLISDVVFFQEGPGVRKHQYTSKGVKLLNVTNILDGYLDLEATDRYISEEEAYGKYKHFLVDEGDLLIACSGIKISYFDKKITFVSSEDLPLCMNTSTMRFKTNDENKLNIKYFYYFLKSNYFKKQLARQITGSAQLNFGPSHIKKMFIMIPEIEYQKILAKILDKITKLIEIRRKQIQANDDLIESLFQTLFVRNTSGIDIIKKTMGDVMTVNQGLQIPIAKRLKKEEENCYEYITIKYLNGNSETEYIKAPKKSVICSKDDILVTRTGNTGQIVTGVTGVFHNNFFKLNYDRNVFNTIYLYSYLNTYYVQEKMKLLAGTSTIPDLNHGDFYKIDVLIPPIELQNKFAEYVIKIEEEKKKLNSSLAELETLFDALMQDAFSGNLFKDWEGR